MPCPDHPSLATIDILTVLRALADPMRLAVVRQLHEQGEATCAELLRNRPKSSMSHHFHVLRDSGILHTRVEGLHHYNSLRRQELDQYFPGLMTSILLTTKES
ncbi:ArsR family transcriptional regulator [Neokomagataea thailandica NBRC 106555]|uniref:ArsR family transcriptional regulator n=2 Tax=Neokomagataea TaxID=1223423 RepID=A0A4Y6VAL1_9PROT|nr:MULTISPECIES: helix-turn-helix domain-containing protein [Neokomagataea]QDH25395.1 ArsR family transcriptional regulator [Neokomagataea tanensis]GBR53518.1 ArsR family transcriptional regulator [Neokomagataea thailandica NBRC 106555]